MNSEEIEKLSREWLVSFSDPPANDADLLRLICMFAKEVERHTRHAAFDIAQQASNQIRMMNN